MNNVTNSILPQNYQFKRPNRIGLLVNGVIKMYSIDEIIYLEGKRNYTNVVTSIESIIITKTLNTLHLKLPDSFVRIHKSYVLNINACTYIDMNQRHVITTNNELLPISIRLKKNLDKFIL